MTDARRMQDALPNAMHGRNGRTDGSETPQDRGDIQDYQDAREPRTAPSHTPATIHKDSPLAPHPLDPETQPVVDGLLALIDQLASAADRMHVVRSSRNRSPLPDGRRRIVLLRDRYTCQWCGDNGRDVPLEVDHIVPWSAGGTDATDNLRTLCSDCNQIRSNYRTDLGAAQADLCVVQCSPCQDRAAEARGEPTDGLDPDDRVRVFCWTCQHRSWTTQREADQERTRQAAHL